MSFILSLYNFLVGNKYLEGKKVLLTQADISLAICLISVGLIANTFLRARKDATPPQPPPAEPTQKDGE